MTKTWVCKIVPLMGLFLLSASQAWGQGGPPLISDDPATPGDGKWEINTAITLERTPSKQTVEAPTVDLNYGWGERIQLTYEVGYLVVDDRDNNRWHNGVGDSVVGVKWRFLDEDRGGVAMSIFPKLEFNTPPGVARRGLVESGTNLFLPLEVARTFGPWELDAEVGYQFVQHDRDNWQVGLVVGYQASKTLELLAEICDFADQDFRRHDAVANLGARWQFADHLCLLFAAGHSFRNQPDSAHLLVYTGLRFTF